MTTAAEVLSCGFSCRNSTEENDESAPGVEGELTESGLVVPGHC